MSPIPVLVIESIPYILDFYAQALHPRFEVVHVCTHPSSAITELPRILSGNLTQPPASGLGTNAHRPVESRRVPRAVVMGWHAGDAMDEQEMDVREVAERGPLKAPFVSFPRADRVNDSMLYVLQLRDMLKKMVQYGEIEAEPGTVVEMVPQAPSPPPGAADGSLETDRRGGGWRARMARALRRTG